MIGASLWKVKLLYITKHFHTIWPSANFPQLYDEEWSDEWCLALLWLFIYMCSARQIMLQVLRLMATQVSGKG